MRFPYGKWGEPAARPQAPWPGWHRTPYFDGSVHPEGFVGDRQDSRGAVRESWGAVRQSWGAVRESGPQGVRPRGESGPACSDGEYLIREVPHSFLGGHAGWQGREGMLARASGLVGAGRQRRRLVEFRKPCKNTANVRVNAKNLAKTQ